MTRRWLKFGAVGLVGVGVQLAVLAVLTKLLSVAVANLAAEVEIAPANRHDEPASGGPRP